MPYTLMISTGRAAILPVEPERLYVAEVGTQG